MTRLEQALRWWNNPKNCDDIQIPPRHFKELKKAGFITIKEYVELNKHGKLAIKLCFPKESSNAI